MRYSIWAASLLFILLQFSVAYAEKFEEEIVFFEKPNPRELFEKGKEKLDAGDVEKALELFDAFEKRSGYISPKTYPDFYKFVKKIALNKLIKKNKEQIESFLKCGKQQEAEEIAKKFFYYKKMADLLEVF